MMKKTFEMFGVVNTRDPEAGVFSISHAAKQCRQREAVAWCEVGDTERRSWERAKKFGYRVMPVTVTVNLPKPK